MIVISNVIATTAVARIIIVDVIASAVIVPTYSINAAINVGDNVVGGEVGIVCIDDLIRITIDKVIAIVSPDDPLSLPSAASTTLVAAADARANKEHDDREDDEANNRVATVDDDSAAVSIVVPSIADAINISCVELSLLGFGTNQCQQE